MQININIIVICIIIGQMMLCNAHQTTTKDCPILLYPQTTYSTGGGSSPNSVAIGDVNGDSKLDIVVANQGLNTIGVFINSATGIFAAQVSYSAGASSSPNSVAIGDVNGDRKLDVVVANQGSNTIGVLINSGTGMFAAPVTYSTGAGSVPRAVAVGDVNGDNRPDVVVSNSGGNTVGVFLNSGTGTFAAQVSYSTGSVSSPRSAVLGDVNGDGALDIVVVNTGGNNVGVLLNGGQGTFLPQVTYSTGSGSSPRNVALEDLNGDNKLDIVVANSGTNVVGVFLNGGHGTFLPQVTYSTGVVSTPRSVAVADMTDDNIPDIVVGNNGGNNVGIFVNGGNGTFFAQTTFTTGGSSSPISIALDDVDNDGETDVVVANSGGDSVGVFLGC